MTRKLKWVPSWLPISPFKPWVLVDEFGRFMRDDKNKVRYFKTRDEVERAAEEANDGKL